jgi:tetrahydromethanopterin S-methyltransferase subunit G
MTKKKVLDNQELTAEIDKINTRLDELEKKLKR